MRGAVVDSRRRCCFFSGVFWLLLWSLLDEQIITIFRSVKKCTKTWQRWCVVFFCRLYHGHGDQLLPYTQYFKEVLVVVLWKHSLWFLSFLSDIHIYERVCGQEKVIYRKHYIFIKSVLSDKKIKNG